MPSMPTWLAPVERWADRSPIAVRQVRQQLRGRTWSTSLVVVPALCVIGAIACLAVRPDSEFASIPIARVLFSGYLLAWGLICGVFQPGAAGRALRRERGEDTWDLIELAGLGGMVIAGGFWCAALLQILLMSALFAPFLVMTWLLRGVDTAALLLALAVVPAWGALMAALAVYAASAPLPRKKRGLRLGVGTELLALLFGAPVYLMLILPGGVDNLLRLFGGGAVGLGVAASAWLLLVVGCVVHAGTALAHPARNRSTGPRFVACLAAVLIAGWCAGLAPFSRDSLTTAGVLVSLIALWIGLGAMAEFDGTTPRQQRWLDEARGFWKATAWFLGPGCRRGRRCMLLLAVVALACAAGAGRPSTLLGCVGILSYGFAFLLLGDLIARQVLTRNGVHRPRLQTTITVVIPIVLHVVAGMVVAMADMYARDVPLALPVVAIGMMFSSTYASGVTLVVAGMGIVCAAILITQARKREHGTVRLVGDPTPER